MSGQTSIQAACQKEGHQWQDLGRFADPPVGHARFGNGEARPRRVVARTAGGVKVEDSVPECLRCGFRAYKPCAIFHHWRGCYCTKCGVTREDGEHHWEGCECTACHKLRHEWVFERATPSGSIGSLGQDHYECKNCLQTVSVNRGTRPLATFKGEKAIKRSEGQR